jgi:hypothetical protein
VEKKQQILWRQGRIERAVAMKLRQASPSIIHDRPTIINITEQRVALVALHAWNATSS